MATHSSILAWGIPWTEELVGYMVHGVAKSWTQLSWTHLSNFQISKKYKKQLEKSEKGEFLIQVRLLRPHRL